MHTNTFWSFLLFCFVLFRLRQLPLLPNVWRTNVLKHGFKIVRSRHVLLFVINSVHTVFVLSTTAVRVRLCKTEHSWEYRFGTGLFGLVPVCKWSTAIPKRQSTKANTDISKKKQTIIIIGLKIQKQSFFFLNCFISNLSYLTLLLGVIL